MIQRRIGRPRLAMLLVVVVALVLSVGWLTLRPTGSGTAPAELAAPRTADVNAVMQMLQRHADQLLAHDGRGWAADLDDSAAAGDYATHERAVFGNLDEVPLTTWRYVLSAPVTDPTVTEPAATRLGGPVVLVHVQLQYAFAAVDPAPTSKDLWLTAVRRGKSWRLAGDSDVATTGGPSWQGPWDFGPLIARTGPHTLVLAHPAHAKDAATFQTLVERSVPVVTGVWGRDWNDHVAVLIPNSEAEFSAVSGDGADSHDLAAVAVADSINSSGVVLGARIVLNPTNLSRLDAFGRRLVVQHELTHIASRARTSDQMPTWLIEGFADYVGNLDSGRSIPASAPELAAEVRQRKLPAALPTSADFDGASKRLSQAYEESWLACRLIAARVGQQGLVRFYQAVDTAAGTDATTAAQVGLSQVLHLEQPAFVAAWRAALRTELAGTT